MRKLDHPANVIMWLIALAIVSYTWVDTGRWGQHWVFVMVYVGALFYCLVKGLFLPAICTGALIWLRINLAEGVGGWQLQASSVIFAVLFFAMCTRYRPRAPVAIGRQLVPEYVEQPDSPRTGP